MNTDLKQQIKSLIQLLQKYDYYYWNRQPIVPDSVYDTQYLKLKRYQHQFPSDPVIKSYFSHLGDPKQINSFQTFRHQSFIGSLDKIRTVPPLREYLNKWSTNPKDLWNTDRFLIEDKCDGLSCVLYFNAYPHHRFLALTRGGGYYGSDITPEIKYLRHMNIDHIIKRVGSHRLIVRGELLISKRDFRTVNRHRQYANERNAVSGIVNSKHAVDVLRGHVFLDTYTLVDRQDYPQYPTELSQLKFLQRLGFYEDLDVKTFANTPAGRQQAISYCTRYTHAHRDRIPFAIDGLTIKPNNTRNFINKIGNYQSIHRLGWNHHGPVYSKAWKFPPKSAVGIFSRLKWQVSANGRLDPVGVLRSPVRLMGSTIRKASLGSLPDAWHRDLRLGDHVLVRRMNDVIPKFVRPIPQLRNGREQKLTIPCHAKLVGKYVYLDHLGSHRQAVQLQRWRKFVSKPCLNVKGLSIRTLKKLISHRLIQPNTFASLWALPQHRHDILSLPGFGSVWLRNLDSALAKAKTTPLNRVLLGLPIPNAGTKLLNVVSRAIGSFSAYADNYPAWQKLGLKLQHRLPHRKGFGTSSSAQLKSVFRLDIYHQLKQLNRAGLSLKQSGRKKPASQRLRDLHFAITGQLEHPRKYYQHLIRANGGTVQSSVNSKTDFLICDHPSHSNKYKKAQQLHVKIISEHRLLER